MGSTVGVDVDIDREGWQRFEDLYRSSRDDVFAYVVTMLRDRAAAEDVIVVLIASSGGGNRCSPTR